MATDPAPSRLIIRLTSVPDAAPLLLDVDNIETLEEFPEGVGEYGPHTRVKMSDGGQYAVVEDIKYILGVVGVIPPL